MAATFQQKGCLTGGCAACGLCFAPKEEKKMVVQTHTVATDALATLGTIIDETAGRDAIHLAVEPVTSQFALHPGQDVGLVDGKAVPRKPFVGIVDPFLSETVEPGQKFWLVVYPRQITSLRHVWEHPSFPNAETPTSPEDPITSKEASIKWMTEWAVSHMGEDYYGDGDKRSPEAAYASAIDAGHNMNVGPYEDARDHIDSEWWGHWETITGERGDRDSYFSCGC